MKNYSTGYTTGVFDLFHIGHLNILKRAKERCNFLIVGVSTDEVVMQYKNAYPLIPFKERMEIVRSIRYVDRVVPQNTMDKMDAWEQLHFDVMFHGDDWKGSPLYRQYQDDFARINVDLVFLSYTQGTSSSMIKEIINQKVLSVF